jgi:hypothetical protein
MAQTGYTPIQLYYSSTTTNVPLAANLSGGELAINITDGKLFYKDNANAVQVIGWKVRPATAGGTGLTSFAVGDLIYANTTTTLASLADVATGNALISGGVGVAPSYGKIGLTTHVSGVLPVANGGTNASSASITAFNNITGYTASGATGTTSTNLVFSTSPTLVTPTLGAALATSIKFGSGSVLSSYEEGTWTPVGTFVTQGTATSSFTGTYTKVGRQVTIVASGNINKGTASGAFTITGVPFATATTAAVAIRTAGIGAVLTVLQANLESGTGTVIKFLLAPQSTSLAGAAPTAAEMNNPDSYVQLSCTYSI